MRDGSVSALAGEGEEELPGILVGHMLAEQLEVKVGDTVRLLTPQGTLSPMGMLPRTRRARVAGVFELGLLEFDAQWGFVSLDVCRPPGRTSGARAHPDPRSRHLGGAAGGAGDHERAW